LEAINIDFNWKS